MQNVMKMEMKLQFTLVIAIKSSDDDNKVVGSNGNLDLPLV